MKLYPLLPENNLYHNTYGTVPLVGKAPLYHVAPLYKPALALLDLIGKVIFFFLRLKKQPLNPKKILVIRLDHLGDVIMTFPTYAALRKIYPEAEIHTLVRGFTQDLFYQNKNVDKVIPFDPPWFARDKKVSWWQTLEFRSSLRKQYDIVIELHADPRNIIAATIIGGYRIGYGIRGLGFLLHKKVNYNKFDHLIETNLELVRALGYKGKTPLESLKLTFASEDEKAIQQHIKTRYVIINPGTGRPNKYWLAERWATVADTLAAEGFSILFTGSTADVPECEKIMHMMKREAKIVAGKTTLRQLFALIKHSALVLAPDTSIAHFAVCLDTPSITLFGPIPPAICSYDSGKHKAIVKNLPCSYCAKAVCPRTDKPNECMELITAEEVTEQAIKNLNQQ